MDTTRNSAGEKQKGYKAHTKGLSGGADHSFSDNLTAGFAASYADTKANKHRSSDNIDIASYQVSLYALWESNDWFINSILSAGKNKNKVDRYLDGFSTSSIYSEYTSDSYSLNINVGKHVDFKGYKVSPMLGLNYSRHDTSGYKEKDSGSTGTALEVKKSRYERVELGGGVAVSRLFNLENGSIEPSVSLTGWYDAKGQQAKTKSRFLFGSRFFTVDGADSERSYAQFSADVGYSHKSLQYLNLAVGYQRQQSSSAYTDSVYLQMTYLF